MKIRTLTERQARQAWPRLLELAQRGYAFAIKRRGKVAGHLQAIRPTISSRRKSKKN